MNSLFRMQPEWGIRTSRCLPLPQRYIHKFMITLGVLIAYIMRSCTFLVLPYIVIPANITETLREYQCPKGPGDPNDAPQLKGTHNWSQDTQRILSLVFYIGYLAAHIPIGYLANRYGFKWPFFGTVLSSSIITVITPLLINTTEYYGLICINIFLGLSQGGIHPAVNTMLAHWIPPSEHSSAGAIVFANSVLGIVAAQIIWNYILFLQNWSSLYYLTSAFGFGWCTLFIIFCYSSPNTHPCITKKEKDKLNEEIEPLLRVSTVPWKPIMTSIPMWACIIANIGHDWIFYSTSLGMATYLKKILRFSYTYMIVWTCVPLMVTYISAVSWGYYSDYLLARDLITLTDLRKLNTLIGNIGTAAVILFSFYSHCQYVLAVAFFMMCSITMGPYHSGVKLAPLDMSPNYAGILMSLTNGLGAIGAIIPNILNDFTTKTTLSEWRTIAWLDFVVAALSTIIYMIFGTSKPQLWNTMSQETRK